MYTHSSPTSRKQHRDGWRHRENFRKFYETIINQKKEEQQRKFFEEKGLLPPPFGIPPPRMLFAIPPPPLPQAAVEVGQEKRMREDQ